MWWNYSIFAKVENLVEGLGDEEIFNMKANEICNFGNIQHNYSKLEM